MKNYNEDWNGLDRRLADSASNERMLDLTTEIVVAHVANNTVGVGDVGQLIANVFAALNGLAAPVAAQAKPEPAVAINKSVKPDYLICLEDGAKLKVLKRYLAQRYNMTPEQYRAKWGLPKSYPMVAPNYSDMRREMALNSGLGKRMADAKATKRKAAATA